MSVTSLIDRRVVEELLIEIGRPYKDVPHKGEFYVCSPFAPTDRDYKCIVSYQKGGIFHCFKSGAHGNFFKLTSLTRKIPYHQAKSEVLLKVGLTLAPIDLIPADQHDDKESFKLPERFEKFDVLKHEEFARYLLDRNVNPEMADQLSVYVDPDRFHRRVVFPVSEDGELIGFSGRTINSNILPRWYNSARAGTHMVLFTNRDNPTLYLFEGVFDAVKVPGGVCTFGSSIGEKKLQKILDAGAQRIVCVFDNDQPGINAQIAAADWLSARTSGVYVFDWTQIEDSYKDFSEIDDPSFFTSMVYDDMLLPWPDKRIQYDFKRRFK